MDIYKENQIYLTPLQNKTVSIIGYGNQGRPHALNLKDSGIHTIIGLRPDSSKKETAQKEGFEVFTMAEAVSKSDVIMMMLPDDQMGSVYRDTIEPNFKPVSYLGFCHGMAIHAGWIIPSKTLNVFLLAPKAQGRGVRNRYLQGSGVPGLVAVHQDPTGNTLDIALAYGKAIGCARAGIIKTTFAQETETDLFSEQTVLCGGLTQLIKTAFEVLVDAGYSPEVAYFECLYEVKLIADLLQEGGISYMREHISSTALFGDVLQGSNVIDSHVKETMERILKQIQSGSFAQAFMKDVQAKHHFTQDRFWQDYFHPIEEAGRKLREEGIL